MSHRASASRYYIRQYGATGRDVQGPFPLQRLRAWRQAGKLEPGMEVSEDGRTWTAVRDMPALRVTRPGARGARRGPVVSRPSRTPWVVGSLVLVAGVCVFVASLVSGDSENGTSRSAAIVGSRSRVEDRKSAIVTLPMHMDFMPTGWRQLTEPQRLAAQQVITVSHEMIKMGRKALPPHDLATRLQSGEDVSAQEIVDVIVRWAGLADAAARATQQSNAAMGRARSLEVPESTLRSIQSHYMSKWRRVNIEKDLVDRQISAHLLRSASRGEAKADAVTKGLIEKLGADWARKTIPGLR